MRRVELTNVGIHPQTLSRLAANGVLSRVARGLYQLADAEIAASHNLAGVAKLTLNGVINLVFALQFHELTLQMPNRVWVAIGPKARKHEIEYPPTRIVRFGERALSLGVQTHTIDRVPVLISIQPRLWWTAFGSEGLSASTLCWRDSIT